MPSARIFLRAFALSLLVLGCSEDDTATTQFLPPGLRLEIVPAVDTLFVSDTITTQDRAQLSVSAWSVNNPITTPAGLVFSSLTPGVVTVDQGGVVTPIALGTGTVEARINGIKTTATIVVLPKVASILFNKTSLSGAVGDTLLLTATAFDSRGQVAAGTAYSFRASDPTSAVVTQVGTGVARIVPLRAGSLTIIATAGGKTASISGTIR
jgi:uncharacterized protein YjdB